MNLSSHVSDLPMVGPSYTKRLEKLGIKTIYDLLHHVPHRYLDFSKTKQIAQAKTGEIITVKGEVVFFKNQHTKTGKKMQMVQINDETGSILATWFNQPYLANSLKPGVTVSLAGQVSWWGREKAFLSPEYEVVFEGSQTVHTGKIIPVYPETAGVSSKWLRRQVLNAYKQVLGQLDEFLPSDLLSEHSLPDWITALTNVHFPKTTKDHEQGRLRLAFNELLSLQLKSQYKKLDWEKNTTTSRLRIDSLEKFTQSLPFELTPSQKRTINEICSDLTKETPMNRLLEGDVGSGKTVVAAAACYASFTNGFQSIIMAPTQILAHQHYLTLNKIFINFNVKVSLVTANTKKEKLDNADIFVGTHALIHKKAKFEKAAVVVIDEQHRFGVEQRAHLTKKTSKGSTSPHVLTMTATPIPRTVALTVYGDLSLSTLDEMPKGRQKITTWLVPPEKRDGAYSWIEQEIKKEKIQAFVICPLIEESEKESMKNIKAASAEFGKLKNIFNKLKVDMLHGRQKADEKNKIIDKFKKGETDILVSTPVVEVGIDVSNATIMLIEAADRFGLSQLHQLRGRVGRGSKKSYCLLFTESKSPKSTQRLEYLKSTASGRKLAEYDLQLRGPGEVFGTRQHGYPELKIASWQDTDLIKLSKKIAIQAFDNPNKYRKLFNKMKLEKVAMN
jgi:ATP-dependent DNA helicase RecG